MHKLWKRLIILVLCLALVMGDSTIGVLASEIYTDSEKELSDDEEKIDDNVIEEDFDIGDVENIEEAEVFISEERLNANYSSILLHVPFYPQKNSTDCPVACLSMTEGHALGVGKNEYEQVYNVTLNRMVAINANAGHPGYYGMPATSDMGYTEISITLESFYNQLAAGRPILIYGIGSADNPHWSVIVGYNGSTSTLETSGFILWVPRSTQVWPYNAAGNYYEINDGDARRMNLTSWLNLFPTVKRACVRNTGALRPGDFDTIPPEISNIEISELSENGYKVTCTVTDNIGVDRVQFPTWTKRAVNGNEQDDLDPNWSHAGSSVSGVRVGNTNTWTYYVPISLHNNELGEYITHIYAYDTSGLENHDGVGVCVSKRPYGAIDKIEGYNESIRVAGWARDDDEPSKPLKIHIHLDGKPGEGDFKGEYIEDVYRTDLNGMHGFDVTFTDITPGLHTLYIYALDSTGITSNSVEFVKTVIVQPKGERNILDGRYHILNGYDLDCRLDNPDNGDPAPGDNLNIWRMSSYHKDEAFNVKYDGKGYYEISRGDCAVDLENLNTESGTNVLMNSKNGSDSQKWAFKKQDNGYYRILSKYNGLELDMDETGETLDGANVTVGIADWPGMDHQWRFLPEGSRTIADGDYYIASAIDENYRLNANSIERGTEIGLTNKGEGTVFTVEWLGGEYYLVKCKDLVLDVYKALPDQNTKLDLWTWEDQKNQHWIIKELEDGNYAIYSMCNALCIDLSMPTEMLSVDNGVVMYDYKGGKNQKWKFVSVKEKPTYTVPTNLKANCGIRVSSVKLPTGFSWTEPLDTVVTGGNRVEDQTKAIYKAKYTPVNTDKYAVVENIDITISVIHNTSCVSNEDGTHSPICLNGDYKGDSVSCHSAEKATCKSKAICDECKAYFGEVDITNHVGETEIRNAKEAKCYEEGYTGDTYCKSCGNKISDGKAITKAAHTPSVPIKENEIPSTCTIKGSYEKVVYCSVEKCQAEVSRETVETDILDHVDDNDDGECDLCHEKAFENGIWIKDIEDQLYTGKAIIPSITVYDRNKKLVVNKDYAVKITKNVNAGTALVTIIGKGNYTSVETAEFNILPLDISGSAFVADEMAIKVNGRDQKPKPVFTWNGKAVIATGYTYQYFKADDSGNPTGDALPAVKDAGNYVIVITGKGNFDKTRNVKLTVADEQKLVSKLTVVKIPNQPYTGAAIEPVLTVKDGRTELTRDVDYTVEYFNNTKVGTAYAVVTGIGSYSGSKRVSIAITGIAVTKATVEGLPTTVTYTGNDITFDNLKLYIKATLKTEQIDLKKDIDYEVSYINNNKAGVATVVFTGINGYTGVLKKTFRINAFKTVDSAERVSVSVPESIVYSKGGARPAVTVTFSNGDGTVRTLTEKTDYTVVYTNNTAVTTASTVKIPTVKVTLRGSYSGVVTKNFSITPKNLEDVIATATDKVYTGRPNAWKSAVVVTDTDGKKLAANRDYDTVIEYTYAESGKTVQTSDVVKAGTVIKATVKAKSGSNYTGTTSCTYRITQSSLASAKVTVGVQTYTGKAVEPDTSDIVVKMGTVPLVAGMDYEIVPGSYVNNVNKGTASVTIKGIGNYGGTKKVNFIIRAKGFTWWWR